MRAFYILYFWAVGVCLLAALSDIIFGRPRKWAQFFKRALVALVFPVALFSKAGRLFLFHGLKGEKV